MAPRIEVAQAGSPVSEASPRLFAADAALVDY
jgi:hypothetical protein